MNLKDSFRSFEAERRVSFCRQFVLLFKRQMTHSCRLPMGLIALLMMAFFNSFILSTVFGGVGGANIKIPGKDPFDPDDPFFIAYNMRISKNWLGVINFAATD